MTCFHIQRTLITLDEFHGNAHKDNCRLKDTLRVQILESHTDTAERPVLVGLGDGGSVERSWPGGLGAKLSAASRKTYNDTIGHAYVNLSYIYT